MSLTFHTLHEGEQFRLQHVCCRPHSRACSGEEYPPAYLLALPLRGVFVKHHQHGGEVVTSASTALFFNSGESYRVSHPTGDGDDCLVLELPETVLRESLETFDARRAGGTRGLFQRTHVTLTPPAALQTRFLWAALRALGDTMEIETTALELFGKVLATTYAGQAAPPPEERRVRSRRREQVHAAAVELASRPELNWTLPKIARQVHCSPFHLARAFRRETGESIHQYLSGARLTKALEALADSNLPVTEIAVRFGFATPSHLAAAFRRRYGATPTAMRKAIRTTSANCARF